MKRSFALKLPFAFVCIIVAGVIGMLVALLMLPVFLAEPRLMKDIADMVMQRFSKTMAQVMIRSGGTHAKSNGGRNPRQSRGSAPDNQQPIGR